MIVMPVAMVMLRDEPAVFYSRIHGGPHFQYFDQGLAEFVLVGADEAGFTDSISAPAGVVWPVALDGYDFLGAGYRVLVAARFDGWEEYGANGHQFLIAITPEYVFFRDFGASLVVPTRLIPAWVIEEMDFAEMFNHLALFNRYFSSIVAPVFLLIFVAIFVMQTLFMLAAIWLFGHWVKLSGNMTVRERFAVCSFASLPAGMLAFAVGVFIPVVHVFIFQLFMIYFTYKAIKEFWGV